MNTLNIIVLGKTGAGKSTLINAVLRRDAAPEGKGQAVTRKNQLYSQYMQIPLVGQRTVGRHVNLYDTVGLEIDNTLTEKTLRESKEFIALAQRHEQTNDATILWFCVNNRSSRFESYEASLLKKLSLEQEIPFIVVLTQCWENKEGGLEQQIKRGFPDVHTMRVLAKDYRLRGHTVEHYGTDSLLRFSIEEYDQLKISVLKKKLTVLDKEKKAIIDRIQIRGKACIDSYAATSFKIGFLPGLCAPIVHGICIKMMTELHDIAGIHSTKTFLSEIFSHCLRSAFGSAAMMIPLASMIAARSYIRAIGESYLQTLLDIVQTSTLEELRDNELVSKRIRQEIEKRKGRI